jgi:hypothetical protein
MVPKKWFEGKPWLRSEIWEPLVVPAIVILVGLSAFALGRLSAVAGQDSIGSVILNQ